MKLPRARFAISSVLFATLVAAIAFAMLTYPSRQIEKTKALYDEQKRIVNLAITNYIESLAKAGYAVKNHSSGLGGSGEWRNYVVVVAASPGVGQRLCYVEVMGFVSHDANDRPTWMKVLPMRISHRGHPLNDGFIEVLVPMLEERRWAYKIDSRIQGDAYIPGNSSGLIWKNQSQH